LAPNLASAALPLDEYCVPSPNRNGHPLAR
jgi:hypothetical protein